MRKIIELSNTSNPKVNGITKAKVYWDAEWQEYIAKFYLLDGQTKEVWDYHTTDKEDAINTARFELGL